MKEGHMLRRMIRRTRHDERGVAMSTVLLIGATLTVLASTAVVVTVQDFRASTDDRKAAEALAYAEAGIDRMIHFIRSGGGNQTYGSLVRAGCTSPAITLPATSIGNGTFTVTLQVFNPNGATPAERYPTPPDQGACAPGVLQRNPRRGQHVLITSTGEHPVSKRVVQQVVKIAASGLPVGVIADSISANGTPDMEGISVISEGPVFGRNQLDLTGLDAYYTLGDFWPDKVWGAGLSAASRAPAAAHAVGGLFVGSNPEFPPNPNCNANKSASNKQSLWDGDGSAGAGTVATTCTNQPIGYAGQFPNTSRFTQADYDRVIPKDELSPADDATLKRAAQDFGIYCQHAGGAWSCTRLGVAVTGSPYVDYASLVSAGTRHFVAYYEFTTGDASANWFNYPNSNSTMWAAPNGCSLDPLASRSIVVRVKNGGFNLSGNTQINGAIFADGNFDYTGTPTINGSVMASNFRIRGTANFSLDDCWVENMPLGMTSITPTQWREADR
jgi:hypothetical protein